MRWDEQAPAIGDTASRSRQVAHDDIARFTALSGDRNPLHHDPEAAAATPFGGIVVHGGVTTAILNALVAEDLPGPGTVFLELSLRFRAPVRPGDTITGIGTVTSVRHDKPITELDVAVTTQDGTVAVEGHAVCWTMELPTR